ncbi:hypothetical protein HDZ31DRAFT_37681, partial [Schizophyllum fasciatum]
ANPTLHSPCHLSRRDDHDFPDDILRLENICVWVGESIGVDGDTLVIRCAQSHRGVSFLFNSCLLRMASSPVGQGSDAASSRDSGPLYHTSVCTSSRTVSQFARASSLMDVGGALDNVYIAWLSTSAFCDLLICGSLLHTLYGAQRQLAMGPTRPLISRVITLTMETTTLTTVAAVVSAILSATLPMTRFHFMMFLILMKLYSNTLLVTLNARSARGRSLEGSTEVVFWSDMSDVPPSRTRVGQTATSATTSLPAMQFAVPLQDRRSEDCEGRRSYRDTPADGVSIRKEDEVSPSEHWV